MAIKLFPDFSTSPTAASSAQLRPAVKPTVHTPSGGGAASTQRAIPSSTPSIPSSNGGGVVKQNGGWYWNPATGQAEQYWANGQQSSNPFNNVGVSDPYAEMRALADEDANRANNLLNERESYLKGEDYNTGLADIDRSYAQVSDNLAARKREGDIQSQSDIDALGKSYRTANDDAVRSYNALQQRARALFGRGNSAGEASSTIAQEAYYKQSGGISQAFINQEGQIRARAAQMAREYDDNLKEIDYEKTNALSTLKKNLNDKLQEIATMRVQVESQRTQMRMGILQDALNWTRQIQSIAAQQKANLQTAIAEKMLNTNNDFNAIAKAYNIDTGNTPYVQFSTDPTKYGAITYQSPDAVMSLLARAPKQDSDDLENANPFYA